MDTLNTQDVNSVIKQTLHICSLMYFLSECTYECMHACMYADRVSCISEVVHTGQVLYPLSYRASAQKLGLQ